MVRLKLPARVNYTHVSKNALKSDRSILVETKFHREVLVGDCRKSTFNYSISRRENPTENIKYSCGKKESRIHSFVVANRVIAHNKALTLSEE